MAESLSQELMEKEIIPQTLTLKFKTTEFKVIVGFHLKFQLFPTQFGNETILIVFSGLQ